MNPTKAMVIDDSKTIRRVMRKGLLELDFKHAKFTEELLWEADDGLIAFSQLGKHPDVELLFADINMPNLTGIELMDLLYDTEKLGTIKVIFITTETLDPSFVAKYKDNILGLIQKPINMPKLLEKVDELLDPNRRADGRSQAEVDKAIENSKKMVEKFIKTSANYFFYEKLAKNIDEAKLRELMDMYINPEEPMMQEEFIGICFMVLGEYFAEEFPSVTFHEKKFAFLFNREEALEEEAIEVRKDPIEFDFSEFNDSNIEDYFEGKGEIDAALSYNDCLKTVFSPVVSHLDLADEFVVKNFSLSHRRVGKLIENVSKNLVEMDYSIETSSFLATKNDYFKVKKYTEYFRSLNKKCDYKMFFKEVFQKSQYEYMLTEFVKANFKLDKANRDQIEKLVKDFNNTHLKPFAKDMKEFIEKTLPELEKLLDYKTFLFDKAIWDNARKSAQIKQNIQSHGMRIFNTKEYFEKYMLQLSTDLMDFEKHEIDTIKNYYHKTLKREVLILTGNLKDSETIKDAFLSVDESFNVNAIPNKKMLDKRFDKELAQLIIIDEEFDGSKGDEYIGNLFETYIFLQGHAKAIQFGKNTGANNYIEAYIKSPLSTNSVKEAIENI
jgi:two-component system chemotaxis response regulator CheY